MPTVLPKRIHPDRLKNTFVELRFKSQLPYELLPGLLYPALGPAFQAQPRLGSAKAFQLDPALDLWMGFEPKEHIFRSEKTVLKITDGSLVFDTVGGYNGWAEYSTAMGDIVGRLLSAGHLEGIHWIGIRYVSEYPDTAIFDCVKWTFKFGSASEEPFNTTFRTEWRNGQDTVIVNLANNLHFTWENTPRKRSIVDVDVNTALPLTNDATVVASTLNRLHAQEKATFFGLLSDDFLQSLHPEY